ncbi:MULTISPECIES: 16S rRNA (guanine(527)-N(7))-methyltransferase RsmG [Pseudidiomarina]|uniref:Ribosomal RNA small subunit methyltransferase G n=2 Tax=Pseudidiomarina TaxID=2800384 RepID=A0A368UWL5_9GAMM|nr:MULTISPECIES: 16S rRNA (guanine(527)-N(7))-methyltransferase RsmG [Pseudidiomarina]PWW13798.1 16S rRNA m(7)G-527 methyltransferase [Pseudidiomarina maritima]RBP91192.1 16S rRNA m(7)G-527 methyltransferase [Pseudidiomarina tainanensis]RCW33206.1 16S rRNA m(7)G-527 methyltransferase [Pseudidiomarina tainanensis]
MLNRLQSLLAQAELDLSLDKQVQLIQLVEQLNKWNKAYNLTSVRDPIQMVSRHIVDSLVVLPHLQGQRFIDVGTGPGLPGLPLAIACPERDFVLLDSLGKRIRFIRQVSHQLGLKNVTAVQSRVEDYQPELKFDGVISRAFASLNDMLNWCGHLPKPDGRYFALKGQYPTAELADLPAQFEVEQVIRLQVPEADGERHVVIIKTRG